MGSSKTVTGNAAAAVAAAVVAAAAAASATVLSAARVGLLLKRRLPQVAGVDERLLRGTTVHRTKYCK